MSALNQNLWGSSKYWWVVLILGIIMVLCGLVYWIWPIQGFAISSQIFGWLLILAGVVRLCISASRNRPHGWKWWLAGGVIDIFIGFMLVRSVLLSEIVFPYFLGIIFVFWGVGVLVSSVSSRNGRYWWLYLINGILLMIIGFLFFEGGYFQKAGMVSSLTALAFIYWGLLIAITSFDMKRITRAEYKE